MTILSSLTLCTAILCSVTFAQKVDTLGNVSISARATYHPESQVYSYTYTVANPRSSTGSIDLFEIGISRPSGTAPLDMNGLSFGDSEATIMNDIGDYAEQESLVTGVSYPTRPGGWMVAITRGLKSVWSGTPMIRPGKSLGRFRMQSKGLPTIRAARVEPYFNVDRWPDIDNMPTLDAADSVVNLMDSLRTIVLPKHLKTIGPTNLQSPFDIVKFIDTIKSYISQSRALGWITNQTSADKYSALFDSAKVQVKRNGIRPASQLLESILETARRDSEKVLVSEAYALIFFNTQFLRDQLSIRK